MKITVGCSMKYRDLAIETVHNLEKLGHTVLFPNLTHVDTDGDNALTPEIKKRFAIEHYAAIDEADVVYFIVPNGIMGTSLKLELGYAFAKNKTIYFSEPTHDIALDFYAKGFIPLGALEKFQLLA